MRNTPFLNYGQHCLTLLSVDADTANAFTGNLVQAVELVKGSWCSAQARQAEYANQKVRHVEYKVGDELLLSIKNVRLKNPGAKKLLPKWIGPYKVIKHIGPVAYQLELPRNLKLHHVFHAALLHPYWSGGTI